MRISLLIPVVAFTLGTVTLSELPAQSSRNPLAYIGEALPLLRLTEGRLKDLRVGSETKLCGEYLLATTRPIVGDLLIFFLVGSSKNVTLFAGVTMHKDDVYVVIDGTVLSPTGTLFAEGGGEGGVMIRMTQIEYEKASECLPTPKTRSRGNQDPAT